ILTDPALVQARAERAQRGCLARASDVRSKARQGGSADRKASAQDLLMTSETVLGQRCRAQAGPLVTAIALEALDEFAAARGITLRVCCDGGRGRQHGRDGAP